MKKNKLSESNKNKERSEVKINKENKEKIK